MELLTLWSHAQSEIEGREKNFIDWPWQGDIPFQQGQGLSRTDLLSRLLCGGYPAALGRTSERSRQQWFDGYVTTLLERDVRDLSKVRDLREFPCLLQAIAGRSSTLLNMQDIARSLALQHETLRRYLALLESLWLVVELPAWSTNVNSRFVKTPKVSLNDSGLLAGLLNLNAARLERESVLLGQCLESFVVMELRKHLTWSQTRAQMYHFRDHKVDIVLEAPNGELIGIEVKATASPGSSDLAGLGKLQELAGKRFQRGILFHTGGTQTVFGKDLYLVPLQRLWQPT